MKEPSLEPESSASANSAIPAEKLVGRDGFEPSKSVTADLQSAPFGHSGTYPSYGAPNGTIHIIAQPTPFVNGLREKIGARCAKKGSPRGRSLLPCSVLAISPALRST